MAARRDRVLVLGLGASGVAVARYCASRVPEEYESVTVADAADSEDIRRVGEELRLAGVTDVHLAATAIEGAYDLCVASPGIAPHAPLMLSARAASERVISEIQFAFERSGNPWVAITGTNGKTTTTALTTHLLVTAGMPARAVGNIGTPAIEAVGGQDADVLVAEVSSFQLALTDTFHPKVAVLLNITEDHIDWHGSFERYASDKAKVLANLTKGDVAVIGVDDPVAARYADSVPAEVQVVRIRLDGREVLGASAVDGMLTLHEADGDVLLVAADDLQIRGSHNVTNALAAAAAARAMGASASSIRNGLASFEPIEHRLEPAGRALGADWFNDSKATNPDAVVKALSAFDDRPLVLLLGGRNKGAEFWTLAREAAERTRAVVVFGEARNELAEAFEGSGVEVKVAEALSDAVAAAAVLAAPGDAVLLSPACASFDEFSGYEERGRSFKALVSELAEREAV